MEYKILALDIATKTGWKTETASGVWNLKQNRGESDGMRLIRFKSKLREIIKLEKINMVSYERPSGRHKYSIIFVAEMVGILKSVCIELKIDFACYSSTEIKKFATGKGNCGKLVDAAKKLGYNPLDDNEADAIFIYLLTCNSLNL